MRHTQESVLSSRYPAPPSRLDLPFLPTAHHEYPFPSCGPYVARDHEATRQFREKLAEAQHTAARLKAHKALKQARQDLTASVRAEEGLRARLLALRATQERQQYRPVPPAARQQLKADLRAAQERLNCQSARSAELHEECLHWMVQASEVG